MEFPVRQIKTFKYFRDFCEYIESDKRLLCNIEFIPGDSLLCAVLIVMVFDKDINENIYVRFNWDNRTYCEYDMYKFIDIKKNKDMKQEYQGGYY